MLTHKLLLVDAVSQSYVAVMLNLGFLSLQDAALITGPIGALNLFCVALWEQGRHKYSWMLHAWSFEVDSIEHEPVILSCIESHVDADLGQVALWMLVPPFWVASKHQHLRGIMCLHPHPSCTNLPQETAFYTLQCEAAVVCSTFYNLQCEA
eukprot:scaffold16031_cov18-Tisochrysis_lutea.AAC.1